MSLDWERHLERTMTYVDELREEMNDRVRDVHLLALGLVVLYLCVAVLACHAAFG